MTVPPRLQRGRNAVTRDCIERDLQTKMGNTEISTPTSAQSSPRYHRLYCVICLPVSPTTLCSSDVSPLNSAGRDDKCFYSESTGCTRPFAN